MKFLVITLICNIALSVVAGENTKDNPTLEAAENAKTINNIADHLPQESENVLTEMEDDNARTKKSYSSLVSGLIAGKPIYGDPVPLKPNYADQAGKNYGAPQKVPMNYGANPVKLGYSSAAHSQPNYGEAPLINKYGSAPIQYQPYAPAYKPVPAPAPNAAYKPPAPVKKPVKPYKPIIHMKPLYKLSNPAPATAPVYKPYRTTSDYSSMNMYNAPQPVYKAPQPVYKAPQPVYNAPQKVYNAPQPVYDAPQPIHDVGYNEVNYYSPTYDDSNSHSSNACKNYAVGCGLSVQMIPCSSGTGYGSSYPTSGHGYGAVY